MKMDSSEGSGKESPKETVQPELVPKSFHEKADAEISDDPSTETSLSSAPKEEVEPESSKESVIFKKTKDPNLGMDDKRQEKTYEPRPSTSRATPEFEELTDNAERRSYENPSETLSYFDRVRNTIERSQDRTYYGASGRCRLTIDAQDHVSKKIEPDIKFDGITYRISFDVSYFDRESILCRVEDNKIDVYINETRANNHGFEFLEVNKTFIIPKQLVNASFNVYIADGRLFIETSVPVKD